nr:hypothetical protein [Kibdelosporangium sp. MJ126-NF4]CTQ90145.1 hypothetical protein [Kibdelosporangium sp. MJ126-NF4]
MDEPHRGLSTVDNGDTTEHPTKPSSNLCALHSDAPRARTACTATGW